MISKKIIEKIILAGCQAPSGGNSQPWRFEVGNDKIVIISEPEKDHPVLNIKSRGTWMAHGALIENMCIAASEYNLKPNVEIFPKGTGGTITATISLIESPTQPDPLAKVIYKRSTNRKPFRKESISSEILQNLKKEFSPSNAVRIGFITNRQKIDSVARAMSVSEKVMFKNRILHGLFFKEIAWNKNQEKRRGGGLLLDTLELKIPQRVLMRLLQYWPVMRVGTVLGIHKQIAKENAATHSSCGLLCVVRVSNDERSFLEAGRQIERLWLSATQLGLSVQLNTGIFFFWQGIGAGENSPFSSLEKNEISEAYSKILTDVSQDGSDKNLITAILRVGYGGEASAKSLKIAPKIVYN